MTLPPGTPPLPEAFLAAPLAHRALHDRARGIVENSPGAVRAAVAAGYGIEIDVQLSSDRVAMVFHDDQLERLTAQSGPIRGWSSRDLGKLPLTGTDETIPTLGQVLDLVAGQVPLLIELKDQSGGAGNAPDELERAVAACLAAYRGPVAIMSFNPFMVANMAKRAPGIPRGLTTEGQSEKEWPDQTSDTQHALRLSAMFEDVGAGFVSHHWRDLSAPRVAALKARGVPVLCWTIRSAEEEATARRVADNITFEGFVPSEV